MEFVLTPLFDIEKSMKRPPNNAVWNDPACSNGTGDWAKIPQ
jgi:hypothetical protein